MLSQLLPTLDNQESLDEFLFNFISEFASLYSMTMKQLTKIKAVKKSTQQELNRRLFLAKEYMVSNVSAKLTVDYIAKEVCLNKFHFIKYFKELYSLTPHQYHIELKLQKAYLLLKNKQCSVSEVCYYVGFESLGTFSNIFKKRFKITPAELLKNI